MKTKYFVYVWLVTTTTLFLLNGLFHGLIAPPFFDPLLSPIEHAMKHADDLSFTPIIIQELLVDFSVVSIITLAKQESSSLKNTLLIAILFYASTALTLNLSNNAIFISWPLPLVITDVLWHAATGIVAGWIIYKVYSRKLNKRKDTKST